LTAHPILHTRRLLLRPFTPADAGDVQRLAGDRAIADTTANIPHPYPDGLAEQWIANQRKKFETGELLAFAMVLRDPNSLIGAISLMDITREHERAEIGFWVGKPYWNQGYCTEAAEAVVQYGFSALNMYRIHSTVLKRNPASSRVMLKLGMTPEGCLRAHDKKWEQFEDILLYGMLRSEWRQRQEIIDAQDERTGPETGG
jgi:[ribosomal protein S5]-alanine N-acetyltransferase